jgi:hypothetical protein
MGMFDYINYGGHEYQTKDTPDQFMEHYEIRHGELWYKQVEREYIEDDGNLFGGCLHEISHEWKFLNTFDGLIRIYREDEKNGGYKNGAWIEYDMLFMNGKIIKLTEVQNA